MNLTTMRTILKSELRQNSPYIDGAIADSIDYNKSEVLKFNGGSHTIMTQEDVHSYQLPKDFISLRGDVYITPESGSDNNKMRMGSSSVDMVEELLFSDYPTGSESDSGSPRVYAITNFGDPSPNLLIAPRPSTGGDALFFRYTKDIGSPKFSATFEAVSPPTLAPTFTLLGENGDTLPSTYTSAWFTEGRELVRSRAMYYLWTRYHGGTEEASVKAQAALMQWTEEILRHRKEVAMSSIPKQVRRYI